MHVLLLSAGKVLKTPFGGEDIFTRLLGKWLANKHHEVTLMGIEFAGIKVKRLTYNNVKDERISIVGTKKNKTKKFGLSYLSYSLRTVFWIFQVLKIILINITDPINIIHAQDSGYTGLAAIVTTLLSALCDLATRFHPPYTSPLANKEPGRFSEQSQWHPGTVWTRRRRPP